MKIKCFNVKQRFQTWHFSFSLLNMSYSAFRLSGQRMKGLAAYKVNFLWSWMDSLLGKVRSISAAQNCGPFKCNALYYLNFAGLHNSRDVIAFVRVCRWSSWLTVTNDRRPYGMRTNELLVAGDRRQRSNGFLCYNISANDYHVPSIGNSVEARCDPPCRATHL